jgi:hypothetical protein
MSTSPYHIYIGTVPSPQECCVPPNSLLRELKCCENCPALFVRTCGSGLKFCSKCRQRSLMPLPEVREFKEFAPARASAHAIHYDDSLRKKRDSLGDWRTKLIVAFLQRGPLSAREMIEITGHAAESDMVHTCYLQGITLEPVGSAWPRRGRGNPAKIYAFVAI